ncbi:MAG: hypothetical protein DMG10_28865, partial [Acidobacteria bacterium]
MVFSSWRAKVAAALLIGELGLIPAYFAKDAPRSGQAMHLTLRTRLQPLKAGTEWQEATLREDISTNEAAIIICDMWDNH